MKLMIIDLSDANSWTTEIGLYKIAVDFNGFVVEKEDLDPNYKGTGSTAFDLFIEEQDMANGEGKTVIDLFK